MTVFLSIYCTTLCVCLCVCVCVRALVCVCARAYVFHVCTKMSISRHGVYRFERSVRRGTFLPESTFSADFRTMFVQPPCVIARITKSVRTLRIPSNGSHSIVWTYDSRIHTMSTPEDGMWLLKWQGNCKTITYATRLQIKRL